MRGGGGRSLLRRCLSLLVMRYLAELLVLPRIHLTGRRLLLHLHLALLLHVHLLLLLLLEMKAPLLFLSKLLLLLGKLLSSSLLKGGLSFRLLLGSLCLQPGLLLCRQTLWLTLTTLVTVSGHEVRILLGRPCWSGPRSGRRE